MRSLLAATVVTWFVLLLVSGPFVLAGEKPNLRGDGDDPLPAGAVGRLGTTRFRPAGHVNALAVSPDGKTLATVGHDVGLWDLATGKRISSFAGDRYPTLVTFADKGKTLITVSDPGILRYREVASGKVVHECSLVKDPEDWEECVSITPGGRFLAFKDTTAHTVCVFDLATRRVLKRLKSDTYRSGPIGISEDGRLLAIGTGSIEVWDIRDGKLLRSLKLPVPSYLGRLGFSPDGEILVSSGSHRHGTRSWDWKAGRQRTEYGWKPPETSAFALSSDGKLLATLHEHDGETLRVWDLRADREVWRWRTAAASITSLVFTSDGKTLVTAGNENIIRLWDVKGGKEIKKQQGGEGAPDRLVVSADGRWLTSSNWTDGVLLWDLKSRTLVARFGDASWYRISALSPDGRHIAYAHEDRSVRLCAAATGKEVRVFDRHEKDSGNRDQHEKDVSALAFEPHGQTLLVCHADLSVRARRVADGQVLWERSLERPAQVDTSMRRHQFSWNGRLLFVQDFYRAFEVMQGRAVDTATKPPDGFGPAVLSPDGRTYAAADKAGSLLLFETASGGKRLTLEREKRKNAGFGFHGPIAFSPDGRLLAVPSVDGKQIELWDLGNGHRMHRIDDVQGGVTALAFVGKGQILATGGRDTSILLWDLSTVRKKP